MSDDDPWAEDAGFLAEVMVATYEQRRSQVGPGCAGGWDGQAVWAGGPPACVLGCVSCW